MPEYSYNYCIVHMPPPRPRIGPLFWVLSFLFPLSGWTTGTAVTEDGVADCKREWVIRYGIARRTDSLLHTCADDPSCRCTTDTQFF